MLLNPLAWSHNVVFLALPIALLARSGWGPTLAIAATLLSLPKETLYRAAGAPPTGPAGALILSAHALGALLLFAQAARIAGERDG